VKTVRYFAILAAMLLISAVASAQTGNAIVKGAVSDATGSVVPRANVRLTNAATNVARVTTTSAEGLYYFGDIQPGAYTIGIETAGFKRWSGTLTVQAGQIATIDVPLEVGELSASVEVRDVAPVIATEGMQIADVKDSLRIRQLPLNGRQVANLFNLTPGVEGGGAARVNGLKVGSAEILQDGVSIVNRFGGNIVNVQPGLDTVQEFRIETNGSNARYSRPATVTLVTKSGTNEIHGSLFETHRNNASGLRSRRREEGTSSAKLIRNEFGASAGGPVVIPKLYNGRNRTFWFQAYEGLRQREKSLYSGDIVPTAAMWNGDFSGIVDNNGNRTHIYDPLTTDANGLRQPFAGDMIPENRLSPIFKTFKAITHAPTNNINPYQGSNLEVFYPLNTGTDSYTTRIDHRISDKDNIFGRFTKSTFERLQNGGRFGGPIEGLANGYGSGLSDTKVYSISVSHTHLFSPNLFNELLLLGYRNPNHQGTLADDTPWAQNLGLPNPFGVTGWPTTCAGDFCWDADNRKNQNMTAYNLEDNVTLIRGKHSFIFGGKARREYNNVRELQQAQGSHDFGADWTALYDPANDQAVSYTGDGFASMALGLPTYLSNQFNRGYFYFRQSEFGLYAHDSWRVTPRLTLELGVRWDKWTPYNEKYNRMVNVDIRNIANKMEVITPGDQRMEDIPGVPSSVLASWATRGLTWKTANEAGLPSSLLPADNNNFGPRLGAAFRLTNTMVLRGGYGEYFWTMPLSQILQTSRTNPPLNLRYTNEIGNLDGTGTTALRFRPTPDKFVGSAGVDINGIIQLSPSAQSFMPWDFTNWRDGHAREWNFSFERELMKNTALRLTYIGTHGSGLEQRFSLNARESEYNYQARTGVIRPSRTDLLRVNPDWNFSAANKTGYSNSNSAQVNIERRFSSGLAFQWFYTFTRSKTTSDAGASTSGNGSINDTAGTPAVPENINILGSPNLSYDERLRLVYYNSTAIPPHRMRWNGIYDLPFGKGKPLGRDAGRFLNAIIGGWQIATIGDWRSGNWLSVNANEYLFGNPALSADQRLDLTFNGRHQVLYFRGDFDPTRATNVDQQKLQALIPLNRAERVMHPVGTAFDNRIPQRLADGTTRLTSITDALNWNARAFFLGPRAWNVDSSLFKNFSLGESKRLRFTADFFNAFNHPNDVNPDSTTGLVDLSRQANEPRIVQFSARIEW
jgi:hypothetical protein